MRRFFREITWKWLVAASLVAACGDDSSGPAVSTDTSSTNGSDTSQDTTTIQNDTASPADVTFTACDPFGAACDEGLTCTYLGNDGSAVCVPAGQGATGDACDQDARCAAGICMSLNGTSSRCFDFCRDGADCGGEACIDLSNAEFSVCRVPNIYPACDLVAQDCADEKACYSVANEPEPVCLTPGEVVDGQACEYADSCVRGSACVNGTCRKLCDPVAGESVCDGGQTCTTINESAVGYCAPL